MTDTTIKESALPTSSNVSDRSGSPTGVGYETDLGRSVSPTTKERSVREICKRDLVYSNSKEEELPEHLADDNATADYFANLKQAIAPKVEKFNVEP